MSFQFSRIRLAASAATTALIAVPLVAYAGLSMGDRVGITDEEIRSSLESQGYVVIEIERESDEIEAEVTLNGVEYEIELDPSTGQVSEIELED